MSSRGVPRHVAWRKEAAAQEAKRILDEHTGGKHGIDELEEMAEFMGVDFVNETYLLKIVAQSMMAPLPHGWKELLDKESQPYYYNAETNNTTWDHPLDTYFKKLIQHERKHFQEKGAPKTPPSKTQAREEGGASRTTSDKEAKEHLTAYYESQIKELKQQLTDKTQTEAQQADLGRELAKLTESRRRKEEIALAQAKADLTKQERKAKKSSNSSGGWFGGGKKQKDASADAARISVATVPVQDKEAVVAAHAKLKVAGEGIREVKDTVSRLRAGVRDIRREAKVLNEDWHEAQRDCADQICDALGHFAAAQRISHPPATSTAEDADGASADELVAARKDQQRAEAARQVAEQQLEEARLALERATLARLQSEREQAATVGTLQAELGAVRTEAETLEERSKGLQTYEQVASQLQAKEEEVRAQLRNERQDAEHTSASETRLEMEQLRESAAQQALHAEEQLRAHEEKVGDLRRQLHELMERAKGLLTREQMVEQLQAKEEEVRAQAQMEAMGQGMELDAVRSDNAGLNEELEQLRQKLAMSEAEVGSGQAEVSRRAQQEKAQLEDAHADELGVLQAQLQQLQREREEREQLVVEQATQLSALQAAAQFHGETQAAAAQRHEGEAQQMRARESKAAQECERMFKLVQQAHGKVTAKEREFKQLLVAEKQRHSELLAAEQQSFNAQLENNRAAEASRLSAALEAEIEVRLRDIHKKYALECAARRKIFNQLQELRGNIRVYCRVRPLLAAEAGSEEGIAFEGENRDVLVKNPRNSRGVTDYKRFEFEQVFTPEAGQTALFEQVQPLVTSVLDGYNVCIFAYGQTGSGKTHTMEGPAADPGIYQRSLQELFKLVAERDTFVESKVSVNLLEIYNEQVRDLLCAKEEQASLEIRRGPEGVFVPGLSSVPVTHAEQVMEILARGNEARSVATTKMNEHSSRSHCVLIVNYMASTVGGRGASTRTSQLTLCDLAGSERLSKSEAKGEAMKEAQHINKSLSALADVIAARGSKQAHVPYRNSKLTSLLENSLKGSSKTLMLVHCRPNLEHTGETICALNFATRVRTVELGAAEVAVPSSPSMR